MSSMDDIDKASLLQALKSAEAECLRLRAENERLRARLGLATETLEEDKSKTPSLSTSLQEPHLLSSASVFCKSSPEEKIALFRQLFRGREDVYPVRWENKQGRSGYTPACANEWKRPLCGKPKVKCGQCESRLLKPVTDQVVFDHLAGNQTIGVYPLLPDDTCWFLAADFDKKSWQEDAAVFLEICREMGIPAALERSRSGNGGHVWIFFDSPVTAHNARKLGCAVLTRAMARRRELGFDSYDRFFPNQDTLPKGGFGNLIALPLQYYPRARGHSVFIDSSLQPYPDQWAFLSGVNTMSPADVEALVHEAGQRGAVAGVPDSVEEDTRRPWTLPPSGKKPPEGVSGPLPREASVIQGDQIYVVKGGLPAEVLNRLTRMATFQNPEFYRAQAMRLSTFGKPRIINCTEEFPDHLALPRGCLEEALVFLKSLGVQVNISDHRNTGQAIDIGFNGALTPEQHRAAQAMAEHDNGVLSAATAFGKTVVAAWLIAERKVNTLILVHRKQLMDQWQERLGTFLDLPANSIGRFGGGKNRVSGVVDIATLQSLNRKGEVLDLAADYGHIIVDECHHVSAFSFEQVLRKAKARYVCGLTATPIRKDGHHPIIFMQCGPVRFRVDARKQAARRPFEHVVVPRRTDFALPANMDNPGIQEVYSALAGDEARNEMILNDLFNALEDGCSPILLARLVSHVEELEKRLQNFVRNVIVLRGGMGKKQRQAVFERLAAVPDTEERVLIATGSYIGEGFDDARLDTLFLLSPVSWRGTLQQYAGRLHRMHSNKRRALIYDYVDEHVPQLARMFQKRLAGYRAMGYKTAEESPGEHVGA